LCCSFFFLYGLVLFCSLWFFLCQLQNKICIVVMHVILILLNSCLHLFYRTFSQLIGRQWGSNLHLPILLLVGGWNFDLVKCRSQTLKMQLLCALWFFSPGWSCLINLTSSYQLARSGLEIHQCCTYWNVRQLADIERYCFFLWTEFLCILWRQNL